jgi:hypothetical protein
MRDELFFVCVLVWALALVPHTTAIINAGNMTLKPSGVLSMRAEWEDTPKDGAKYDILIITTMWSTGIVYMHRLNNLEFSTNKISYNIPSGPQTQFIAGTTPTISAQPTFPGFKINNNYRVSIRYYNASGFLLNKPGVNLESSQAVAMVQASPPLNVRACAASDRTSPCNKFVSLAFSVKIMWDWQTSVGYGTNFPPNAYTIDYYIIEISPDVNFVNLVDSMTCWRGQDDAACYFGTPFIAQFQNLSVASTYYYRIRGVTIVGQGQNSSTGIIGLCNVETTPNAPNDAACFLNYSIGCNAGYDYMNGCSACPGGKYARIQDATCRQCDQGKYSGVAAPMCIACSVGTYNREILATACTNCALGYYNNKVGSYSNNDCYPCLPGQYSAVTPTATCGWCLSGTYSTFIGSSTCFTSNPCQAGMYPPTGATLASTCVACPLGKYSSAPAMTCTDCPSGKYSGVVGTTSENECTACAMNMTSPPGSVSSGACVCKMGFGTDY